MSNNAYAKTKTERKKAKVPDKVELAENREVAKANYGKDVEPTYQIEFKSAEEPESAIPAAETEPVEVNEMVTIEEPKEEPLSNKEIIDRMTSSGVVITEGETYFEKLYKKQQEEEANKPETTFDEGMRPEVINMDNDMLLKIKPKAPQKNAPTIAPSENLKSENELEEGMCQYMVNALYIIDPSTNTKYIQGTLLTLPEDITKVSKLFALSIKSGRLVKCKEAQEKITRPVQLFDERCRKWVKKGTPEYEAYKQYLQQKQDKIAASNERKIQNERKKLGLE